MHVKSNSKATMLLPFYMNPLTHSWRTMNTSRLLTHFITEYVKHVRDLGVFFYLELLEEQTP